VRILTRYILREIATYTLLGGLLFTFVLFMRYLLTLMELLVRGSASFGDVARVVGFLLPNLLTLTIPMAVLVGILLGFGRLAADSEITAMRASGLGVPWFLRTASILSLAALALGLANSLYIAPRATAALLQFEEQRKTQQASFEVKPRVFSEDVRNYVLYVQDVRPAGGESLWRHVFLADLTQPATPHIISANEAYVLNGGDAQTLRLHLNDGARHDVAPNNPSQYEISTFASTDLPIQTGQQEDVHLTRRDTPLQALTVGELWRGSRSHAANARALARSEAIELQRRFSYPFACLVLTLVAVPLGLSSKRGGKGGGFVLALALVFGYYFLSSVGIALANQGKITPMLGVWGANLGFALAGALLVQQLSRGGIALTLASTAAAAAGLQIDKLRRRLPVKHEGFGRDFLQRVRRTLHVRFPLILDEYVMRAFLRNFLLTLSSLSALFLIFTFFELIGDIIKYRTPLVTVGDYLLNLIPFILYNVTPVCSLVAVLITFGTLGRTNELTSMKATGVSLYRVVVPVLVVALLLAGTLFAFDELYLPGANKRQEALRSVIKGKPAQTFLRPDRKWISGQNSGSGEPARIFYYQFFDQSKDVFANLTVFEFEPGSFVLQRRIFAGSARWDDKVQRWIFENGWQRTFADGSVQTYQTFQLSTFPEIREQPSYFKKEDRQSQQMTYAELSTYINDLKQSGFDTMRLRVQLDRKLSYPFITFVMAVLAVPFALTAGRRGSMAGMGAGVCVAIAYWVVAGVFENLGNVNSLPPLLAAWSPDLLFGMAGAYLLLRTPT
jgi:LPS export ABC transporter permease LptG/LPS export ABC transporter permease LptF